MNRILALLITILLCSTAFAQQEKMLSIFKDGLIVHRIPVSSIDSMNFNDTGHFLSANDLINAPQNMMDLMVQYDLASTSHDSFGYMAILHATDMMSEDIVMSKLSHFRFDYTHDNNLFNYRRTTMIWKYFDSIIKMANRVIDSTPSNPTNPQLKRSLGHAYGMRAFAHFYLVQLYQFTAYYSTPSNINLPAIPLQYAKKEPLYSKRNYRVPAGEVFAQCETDYLKAKELLSEERSSKNELNDHVLDGLLARLYLLTGKWDKAIAAAGAARQNYLLMGSNELSNGFLDIGNSEWMWGYMHTAESSTIYASFFSHISNLSAGYAGLNYAPRLIDKRLYDAIPASDYRKNWFQNGNIEVVQNVDPAATSWRLLYANLKFGSSSDFSQDYLYMRSAEMLLIEAEALVRLGRVAESTTLINELLAIRSTGSPLTAVTLDEVLLQRRIELWGEGFAYFDLKRLNKGIDRSYSGSNHESTSRIIVPAGDVRWNFEFSVDMLSEFPEVADNSKLPGINPTAPIVISGTTAGVHCEFTNYKPEIHHTAGVIVSRTDEMSDSLRIISTVGKGPAYKDTINLLLPETTYFLKYFYTSQYGSVYSDVLQFTTVALKLPEVQLVVDSVGSTNVNVSATLQFAAGTEMPVLSKGFELTSDSTFKSDVHRYVVEGQFGKLISSLQPQTQYYIRAFASTVDGTAYSTVSKVITVEGVTVSLEYLAGTYTQTDYMASDGKIEATYTVTISTVEGHANRIAIRNFWDGGDFTIYANIDITSGTLSIAPQQIYFHSTYGVCMIYPFDISTNKIDKSGLQSVQGIMESDGSMTIGSWAAAVDAGSFGRYLKSTLKKSTPSSSAPSTSASSTSSPSKNSDLKSKMRMIIL